MTKPDEKLQARGGDMDAPERIWANVAVWSNGQALAGEWNHRDVGSPDDTPYIRADLAAPVRVKPLVWAKSKTTNWNDDWHTVPTGYTVRCADAPERIWATEDAANLGEDKFHTTRPMPGLTEYIRADLMAELVEALRFYADHSYNGYDVNIGDYGLSMQTGEIIKDAGDRARAALAKIKEQKP